MRIASIAASFAVVVLSTPALAQFASEQDRRAALQHYRAGQEFMSAEQFEKAAESFEKAIDMDPPADARPLRSRAGLHESETLCERHPAFSGCRGAFATLHSLQERDRVSVERQRDDEIRELKESVRRIRSGQMKMSQLNADKIESHITALESQRSSIGGPFQSPPEVSLALGSAYFRNQGLDDAEREWIAAITANPRMGEAHNNLAALYAMTGRKKEAETAVKAAEKAGYRVNPRLKDDIKRMPSS